MKKKTKSSRNFRFPSWHSLLLGYAVIASTVAGVALFLFISVYDVQQRSVADVVFKQMVRDTQLAMYQSPTREAGRLVLADMKLTLPATDVSDEIFYDYLEPVTEPGYEDGGTVTFASKPAVYNTSKSIEQFGCVRLVDVTIDQKDPQRESSDFPLVAENKLADGRTLHIYQNKASCANVWHGLTSDNMVELLKQATSL